MAEGFEPYHVPQQSRRDKLRVPPHHHPSSSSPSLLCTLDQPSSPSLSFYDAAVASSVLLSSSSSASDLLTAHEFLHRHRQQQQQQQVKAEEEAGVHNYLMGFVGASTPSSHHHHHPYLDPQSAALNLNPSSSSILENHNHSNPFLYNLDHQNLNNEVVLYKPEPLSLSLSSQHHHQNNSSSQLPPPRRPRELNLQRYGCSSSYGGGGTNSYVLAGGGSNEVPISTNNTSSSSSLLQTPFGPFTGYASILKGSRFLKPAQQLLKEFCDVGQGVFVENINIDSSSSSDSFMDATPLMNLSTSTDQALGDENRKNKSRLIPMLDEVYRRYKLYYQQMQAVVASFEYVAGLGDAAPYANLALKSMSKHFKSLKNAIADQLQFNNKPQFQANRGKDEASTFGSIERGQYSWSQNSGLLNCQSHPVWRPQRGLPERAVTVLRAWLFEHFLHPYPNDTEKLMLAKQTGLSRSQVSNWFINARVRLWKPMVEEIHMLETRQCQKAAHREEQSASRASNDHQLLSSSSLPSENPSTSTQRVQDTPSKRSRNEFCDIPVRNLEPLSNLSYNNLSNHPHVGVGLSMADGGGSSSVSLTLGLYQNNGIGLSQPYPISAAERFGLGLEASEEGFVLNGYEAQSRIFGRDVIGGQLLHDFVG